MMIPKRVSNVLSLFDQREFMAIETDSPTLILAMVLFYILHYLIRKYEGKVILNFRI